MAVGAFVNVPIGAAVALAAPRVLAESPRRRGRFDLPGAITGTAGVTALVYGLISAATTPDGVSHWGMPRSSPRSPPPRCCSPRSR